MSVGGMTAQPLQLPRGALSVRRAAEAAGWRVVTTYGQSADAQATSWALRMVAPDGLRVVACWIKGPHVMRTGEIKITTKGQAWAWVPGVHFPRPIALAPGENKAYTVKDWIAGTPWVYDTETRKFVHKTQESRTCT